MEFGIGYLGIFLLAVGVGSALWRRKRIFDRTNHCGIQRFPSYWAKIGIKAKDGMLGFVSLVFLTAGILTLANRFEDSWGWIILMPVYLYMLFIVIGS
jgi:hypothetical protein